MRIMVKVDLPDEHNILVQDRAALRWAGVSPRQLRASWACTCSAVLRRLFPDDRWVVEVRTHPGGMGPRFIQIEEGTNRLGTLTYESERAVQAVEHAALAWCASLGYITMLRAASKKRAAGAT